MVPTKEKKSASPEQVAQTVALREAGFTALSIGQRLGLSTRTVQRIVSATGTAKGGLRKELVEAARIDLLKRVSSTETIRAEVARLINDDIAHVAHLRSIMLDASEHMHAASLSEAALLMRAAAAYSTALKNTSELIRHSMRKEALENVAPDEIPVLTIRELTPREVQDLIKSQGESDFEEPEYEPHSDGIVELTADEE